LVLQSFQSTFVFQQKKSKRPTTVLIFARFVFILGGVEL